MSKVFEALNGIQRSATPSNPPAGQVSLYPKTDGNWYSLTSAGVETRVTNTSNGASVYSAHITQSSTDAPVVTTLFENDLSAAIVWTRDSAGVYFGTLTGAFTAAKTKIQATLISGSVGINVEHTSANQITVTTLDDAGSPADAVAFFIDIVVYP